MDASGRVRCRVLVSPAVDVNGNNFQLKSEIRVPSCANCLVQVFDAAQITRVDQGLGLLLVGEVRLFHRNKGSLLDYGNDRSLPNFYVPSHSPCCLVAWVALQLWQPKSNVKPRFHTCFAINYRDYAMEVQHFLPLLLALSCALCRHCLLVGS